MQINSFQLKVIACLAMVIDHVGYIFFPNIILFRILGRLAFPIFAFLITQGYVHTKNVKQYFWRLSIFFILSQLIYVYVLKPEAFECLNIFATLLLGLCTIYLYDHINNKIFALFSVLFISIFGSLVGVDYGFFGVLLIFSFYIFNIQNNFKKLFFAQVILILAYDIYIKFYEYPNSGSSIYMWLGVQFVYLISLFIIKNYNGQRGRPIKYLFYAFYPAHLLVLGILKAFS